MDYFQSLADELDHIFSGQINEVIIDHDVTLELPAKHLLAVAKKLRDHESFHFQLLLDVCCVDYLEYGKTEWRTQDTTSTGFSRATSDDGMHTFVEWDKPRFAVVYHLLSLRHNRRLRLKVFLEEELVVPSLVELWPSAEWFEREAFDLFGIHFDGHPDLRRILTDYGFQGHPFRKDFPLIGEVEMHYDASKEQCVYAPVSIKPRVLVPKVIRDDHRYKGGLDDEGCTDA